jgi:hypothetical protein
VDDCRQDIQELKEAVRHLDRKMDERFAAVELRFLGVDNRFNVMDAKMDGIRSELGQLRDSVVAFPGLLDRKLNAQFNWIVGIQFGVLVAVIGVLLSR